MAGTIKPFDTAVEATFTHLGGSLYAGTGNYLLDGVLAMPSYDGGYFGTGTHYIEVEVADPFILWAFAEDHPTYNAGLAIYKWSTQANTFQPLTHCPNSIYGLQAWRGNTAGWHRYPQILPAGRYQFRFYKKPRIDVEWFFEKAVTDNNRIHPVMTAATTNGWTAVSSTGDYDTYPAWQAFDNARTRRLGNPTEGGTTLTLTAPSGTTFTCVGFICIGGDGAWQGAGPIVIEIETAPSTWTSVHSVDRNTNNANLAAYSAAWEPTTGTAIRVRWTTTSYGDVEEIIFFGPSADPTPPPKKALIIDSTTAYTVNASGQLTAVGTLPVTEELIKTNGVLLPVITTVTKEQWADVTNAKILVYGPTTAPAPTATIKVVPDPVFIAASGDINLIDVENIDTVTLSGTTSGNAKIGVLVSFDGGTTWETYANSTWNIVDATNIAQVITSGMTPNVLGTIPSAAWSSKIQETKKVRFGYGLQITTTADTLQLDTISLQVDLKGSLVENTTTTVTYLADKIQVRVTENGTYTIVWPTV